ncbi:tubulin-tyrosine ligase family-domain-containing protein [Baffinella frigidus]|nr:tubulin-tyrosine ligase family-domain-containing protein [Cryptophyta sp. CCMP2293]
MLVEVYVAQLYIDNPWRDVSPPAEQRPDTQHVEVYVAQRYIDNPYLIGGKKLYVLVTSYLPLRIWMYRSGFARFSNHRFTMQRGDISNAYVHLTNVAIQKTAPSYDKETGCKWDLRAMKLFMVSKHGMDPVNKCMADIQTLCIRSLQSVQKTLGVQSLQSVQKVMMNDKHCFELYGYDVMIDDELKPWLIEYCFELYGYDVMIDDDELKPWLIEVNASPSLSSDTTADHELKVGMLEDMTDIVDMEKKMTGREDQVGGFDLIFNNGPVRKERPMGTQTLLGCYNNRVRNKQKLAQAHRVRETHHGEAAAAKK